MPDVRVETVTPRALAALRGRWSRETLPKVMIALLDQVYAVLATQPDVKRGCNVVVYDRAWEMNAGVEVNDAFVPSGNVLLAATPSGRAATATHIGPYNKIGAAHDAIRSWFDASGERDSGVSWEVYGDWEEDERLLRTDIYYLIAEPAADAR